MSKKTQQDQPADDWAGLAQNLFGINLDKATGDEDLLDDDMFKVELPKPPEPPASIPQSEVEFAPAAESQQAPPAPASLPVVAAKPAVKKPPQTAVKAKASEDEPFGFGVAEDVEGAGDEGLTLSTEVGSKSEDAGLTLPEDFDAEGLTLPADFDDGLTLPPEVVAFSADEEEDESDTEVLPAARSEAGGEGRPESPRRRQPRRTREDAYWDMLENWEWEEIPDSDSPRAEGERPRSQRGDRGGGRGGRSGGRGRDERPRSEHRAPAGERPSRDERRPAEGAATARSDSGDRPRRPRSGGDRPGDDRGPRQDRPRGEHPPERETRRRDEPRQVTPSTHRAAPVAPSASSFDDFGSGIFEEQPQATPPSAGKNRSEVSVPRPREESVAQSSRAADAVWREGRGSVDRPIEDALVWPDDDSDVRPASVDSMTETSGLPPAEAAGESDETVSASDVVALDQDDEVLRPRRRRRRRGGPRSESRTSPPPDGNEGTTFDLSDALASDNESPDFIPSAVADDSEVSVETSMEGAEDVSDAGRSSEPRGRGRRRRRRRPEERPVGDEATSPDREPSVEDRAAEAADDEDFVLKPITYSNIPSWEEAIKYLLQPNLVGRNLGPDDADESLENDPRGSGGAEPTPPPPPPRRGGRGRGRRP